MNKLNKLLGLATIAIMPTISTLCAQESVSGAQTLRFNKEFTAAEAFVWQSFDKSKQTQLENRVYINDTAQIDNVVAGFHSVSSILDAKSDSYFGRHRISIGTSKFRGLVTVTTIAGLTPEYSFGVRAEIGLPACTYGYSEFFANQKGATAQIFSGYVGKYGRAEFTINATHQYHAVSNRDSAWVELQLLAGNKMLKPFLLGQYNTTNNKTRVALGIRANF